MFSILPPQKNKFRISPVFLMSAILLLGFFLRIYNLGAESFWGDETLSLNIVKHYQNNAAGLLEYLKEVEVHPPLYYLALKFWTGWFGFSEFAVRLLSVIFGLGVVALAYWSAKIFFSSERIGLLAAFFTAILPIQIEYSQEARPYIIYAFFGLLSVLALWQFLKTRQYKYLAVFILASLAGLYLHYSFIFILAAAMSWWAFRVYRDKRKWEAMILFAAGAVIFLGFYYWLGAVFYKIALAGTEILGHQSSISGLRLNGIFENSFSNLIWLYKETGITRWEIFAAGLSKLAFLGLFAAVIIKKINSRERVDLKNLEPIFFVLWLLVVSVLIFLFSPSSFPYSTVMERHLILNATLIIFLFSGLLAASRGRWAALAGLLFVVSLFPSNARIMADDSTWDLDFRLKTIADHINENYRPKDLVLVRYGFSRTDLNFYLDDKIPSDGYYPAKLMWQDPYTSRETLGFLENDSQSRIYPVEPYELENKMNYLTRRYHPKRVWAVFFPVNSTVDGWLEENNFRHATRAVGSLFPVDLYVKKDAE